MRYIWIDSLCIIQDSIEDWNYESLTMADVYKNSSLNIAATASSNPTGGLFRSRNPEEISPFLGTIAHAGCPPIPMELNEENVFEEFVTANLPLLTRGWVLQERALAPRVLHFGPKYLLWECQTMECSERYANLKGFKESWGESQSLKRPKLDRVSEWALLVREYTACELTQESDKLIAIAGVAKNLASEDNTYHAGLVSLVLHFQQSLFAAHCFLRLYFLYRRLRILPPGVQINNLLSLVAKLISRWSPLGMRHGQKPPPHRQIPCPNMVMGKHQRPSSLRT